MSELAHCHIDSGPERWAIIVHAGIRGTIASLSDAQRNVLREGLEKAAKAGAEWLAGMADSIDAVEAAVMFLEDYPEFDAGRGSAFTSEGRIELDASIMRGRDLAAGSVAGATRIKNPICAARAVMERSSHVMLQGEGADRFAEIERLETAPQEYFATAHMRELLKQEQDSPMGTVGCVALDQSGQLAAGTSTGGTTNKLPGRVGDSPIIGAGTYADSRWCGVSCTGQGEFFIRGTIARSVCAMMEYGGSGLAAAVDDSIQKRLTSLGGKGGLIALDARGRVAAVANTPGLLYAVITASGVRVGTFVENS